MDPFQAKLVAAATGSTLTALTMTPFDVVKTRLQTQPPEPPRMKLGQTSLFTPSGSRGAGPTICCQPNHIPCVRNMSSLAARGEVVCIWENGVFRAERVNGFLDAVKHVWRAEGIRGLWKGAGTTLLIGVPSSTSYMLTYDHLLRQVLPPVLPATLVPLTAGILARTTITSIVSPLELIRTNLQATPKSPETPQTLRSVLVSIRGLARTQGIGSLWRGLGPSLWRDVPFSGLYWASYESLKSALEARGWGRRGQGAYVAFVSGAVSGTSAALLTSPFDVLKTRRQALLMNPPVKGVRTFNNSFKMLAEIVRNEGSAALFAGILPRTAKIAPACGIMIASFEGVGKFLAKDS